jgi:hypothetical protein
MAIKLIIGGALSVGALLTGTVATAASPSPDGLAGLRAATNKFHSIAVAEMGVHWANNALVGDPAIVPNRPEAMVYAPDRHGTLTLAAVEYVVIKADWDKTNSQPPRLFGHTFNFTDQPNRYGLPPFYSLHVWVWKHNPAGKFEMWNPKVKCPS